MMTAEDLKKLGEMQDRLSQLQKEALQKREPELKKILERAWESFYSLKMEAMWEAIEKWKVEYGPNDFDNVLKRGNGMHITTKNKALHALKEGHYYLINQPFKENGEWEIIELIAKAIVKLEKIKPAPDPPSPKKWKG